MGGSEAETPVPPEARPAGGLRASDAERDAVASRLRDEYVAGRLSHETFLHRMDAVLAARQRADLPPLLTDLPVPAQPATGLRGLASRLRGTWSRLTGQAGTATAGRNPGAVARPPGRGLTMGMRSAGGSHLPIPLMFPRGAGNQFSIGRDASCDLAIADMSVSRRHATLERTPDGWLLTDLESTNGTRVNGWRIYGPVPVHPGDLISFGNIEYQLASGGTTPLDPPV